MTVAMFRRVGIDANLENTNSVVCTSGFTWGKWSKEAFTRQVAGEGATFRERKRTRLIFLECGEMVAALSLKCHMVQQHGFSATHMRGVDEGGGEPTTYVVSFPRVLKTLEFLVPGCPSVAHSMGRLSNHFMYRHFCLRVAVVHEGNDPLPRCDFCNLHIPAVRLIKHHSTRRWNSTTQIRWWRRDVAIASQYTEDTFILTGEDK